MIKLLKGESEQATVTKKLSGGAEVTLVFRVKVITSRIQMRLADMSAFINSHEGKVSYIQCQFKNCIEDDVLTINGEDMSANELATMGDYTDLDTAEILGLVSNEIDKHCTFTEAEEKK